MAAPINTRSANSGTPWIARVAVRRPRGLSSVFVQRPVITSIKRAAPWQRLPRLMATPSVTLGNDGFPCSTAPRSAASQRHRIVLWLTAASLSLPPLLSTAAAELSPTLAASPLAAAHCLNRRSQLHRSTPQDCVVAHCGLPGALPPLLLVAAWPQPTLTCCRNGGRSPPLTQLPGPLVAISCLAALSLDDTGL